MAVYVYGHKNPDSDSVCAAIALADLKSKIGVEAVPVVQGELNPESNFILEKIRSQRTRNHNQRRRQAGYPG